MSGSAKDWLKDIFVGLPNVTKRILNELMKIDRRQRARIISEKGWTSEGRRRMRECFWC